MNSAVIHMGLALAGYAAFAVAGVSGWAYLRHERRLKAKDPVFLRRAGSSLETLDRVNLWALWGGFVLFTFGVLDGLWLARGGRMALTDPKAIFTLATWGAYAVVLLVRTTTISRGPKVAALSVACLVFVGITLGTHHHFF